MVDTLLAVRADLFRAHMISVNAYSATVAPCGNRQRFPYGGNNEQRVYGAPTSHPDALGGPVGREHLSGARPHADLVLPLVATLPGARPQWAVQGDAEQCPTAPDFTRTRAHDFDHSPTAHVAGSSGHALQPHRVQHHSIAVKKTVLRHRSRESRKNRRF